MKKILHITPTLPPTINGLGDFCSLMSKRFIAEGLTNNIFFVIKHELINFQNENIFTFNSSDFYTKLFEVSPDVIILHYVGYAYHSKGIPFYLVTSLSKYITAVGSSCKLLVFFHELYSSSTNVFKYPFYTSYFQKKIVKSLYKISNITFTNSELYHKLLERIVLDKKYKNICTGIFSNIPDDLFRHVEKKSTSMIVFGSYSNRLAVIKDTNFTSTINKLKITIIYDIGPGQISYKNPQVQVLSLGSLPPKDVAHYLSVAKYGAIHYSPELMGKSGIFAAYSAFGVITINMVCNNKPLYDGLIEGKNYFNWKTDFLHTADNCNYVKKEISNWYHKRSLQAVTNTIIKYI